MHRTIRISSIVFVAVLLLGSSRFMSARVQISMLEAALETFRIDHGRYPTTDEGLGALIEPPEAFRGRPAYAPGGYLREKRVPDDPWGGPYQYRSPGELNLDTFDLWSYGADGAPGGSGLDADVGNWPGGFAEQEEIQRREALLLSLQVGSGAGGALGTPIYLYGLVSAARGRRSWRSALVGATFGVLLYLVVACTFVSLLFFHAAY